MRQLIPGLLFAALWASASVATKFGVQSVHPLILANVRFFIAGSGMLLFAYGIQRTGNAWPKGKEWWQLTIFALLNTTIYLGAFVLALKQVSAGIGSLSTATNPLFIALLSAIWLRRNRLPPAVVERQIARRSRCKGCLSVRRMHRHVGSLCHN